MEYFDPQPRPKFGGSLWPYGPELPRTPWQGGSEVENEGVRHCLLETTQLQVGKLFVNLSFFKNSVFFVDSQLFVDLDVFWTFFFRYSTPCRPKGSPLCTILRYPFLISIFRVFVVLWERSENQFGLPKKIPPPRKS